MGESDIKKTYSFVFSDFNSEKYSSSEDVSLVGIKNKSTFIVQKVVENYPVGIKEIIVFTSLIFDSWISPIELNQYYLELHMVASTPPENKHIDLYFNEMIDGYYDKTEERIPYQYIASIVYEMDSLKLIETQKEWEIYTEKLSNNFLKIISDLDKEILSTTAEGDAKKRLEDSLVVKKKIINKIISHFELSYIQSQFIKRNTIQAKIIASDARVSAKEATEISTKAKNEADAAKKTIEDTQGKIYTDFIAILGIFSALMFGLFGGFSAFSSLLQTISSGTKISRAVLLGSLLLMGLITLIFLLLNGIANLANRNIKSCCSSQMCEHKIYQRFPVFIVGITFLSFISLLAFIGMLWNMNGELYDKPFLLTVILIIGPIILFIVGTFIKNKCTKKTNEVDVK